MIEARRITPDRSTAMDDGQDHSSSTELIIFYNGKSGWNRCSDRSASYVTGWA